MRFMRLLLTILVTLFFFSTAQVAQAFDVCCLAEGKATHEQLSTTDDSDKGDAEKSSPKAQLSHCGAGCHVSVSAAPNIEGMTVAAKSSGRNAWPDIAARDPFIGEGLIEPPSLA